MPEGMEATGVILATRDADQWQALSDEACIVDGAWSQDYLDTAPPSLADGCDDEKLLGYDASQRAWWAVLDRDVELALITR